MVQLIEGKYTSTTGQDVADFYVKCGMDPKVAAQFVGQDYSIQFKFVDANQKSMLFKHEYPSDPSFNVSVIMNEGQDCCQEFPIFGKVTTSWKHADKPDAIVTVQTMEHFGTLLSTVTFHETGAIMETVSKNHGCKMTENLERLVDIDGTYRVVKCNGLEDFKSLYDAFTMDLFLNPSYKFAIAQVGNVMKVNDYIDDQVIQSTMPLGEEIVFDWDKNVSHLAVQVAPGKFKTIMKHTDGRVQEWTNTYTGNKLFMVGKDLKTGAIFECEMEKFVDFSGDYKLICVVGLDEFMQTLGCPNLAEMKKGLFDPSFKLTLKEVGATMSGTYGAHGKVINQVAFAYGDECTYKEPMMGGEELSLIAKKHGDTIMSTVKGSGGVVKSEEKRTKNFLTKVDEILGTDGIKMTSIYMVL